MALASESSKVKVALFIVTYNKNEFLPNTLFSIARQETSFSLEVCVVDDHSDIDPEPIVREFVPTARYRRFKENLGFMGAKHAGWSLVPKDTDVVVMQSDEVVHVQEDTIETLCRSVAPKTVVFANVMDKHLRPDAYLDFQATMEEVGKFKVRKAGGSMRSGPGRMYFFLGAALKEDLEMVGFGKDILCDCDTILRDRMKEAKFDAVYPGVRGLHQIHPYVWYPCLFADRCKYICKVKRGK